uniref:Ig-like domain-containing protein n=1 Tax=Echinostoma caproni TaxID=27848 RepID=A0A183BGF1_9TREM
LSAPLQALRNDGNCVDPKTRALSLSLKRPRWGTYVCTVPNEPIHPANFIWYHVDNVEFTRGKSSPVSFTHPNNLPFKIENEHSFNNLQAKAFRHLREYKGWKEEEKGPFRITTRMSRLTSYMDRCGLAEMRLIRRCYVRIPSKRPKAVERDAMMQMYDVLREAFDFLVAFRLTNTSASRLQEQNTRRRVESLGFQLHGNGTYLYIPCEYSLFKHLLAFTSMFRGFPKISYHLDVRYEILCSTNQIHVHHHLATVKYEFEGRNETITDTLGNYRYLKAVRLVNENQRNYILSCATKTRLNCNKRRPDAIWRAGTGVTFQFVNNSSENIRIQPDCTLLFHIVHLFEEDTYYCHLRKMDVYNPGQIWAVVPRIAYRIYIQPVPVRWPQRVNLMIGLVILMLWSSFITGIWVVLNWFDATIRSKADLEARKKEAGGRNEMLRKLYRPHMDEDRILFFKLINAASGRISQSDASKI